MHILNRQRQLDELATAAAGLHRIMYIEPSLSDPDDYSIAYTNCTSFGGYRDSDRLYADWYMLPLLQRMLDGMNSPIDLHASPLTHVVWVDCDYNGRLYQDTSILKAFVVDVGMTTMSSFALQTMNAMRSTTHMEVQVGAAIVSSTTLSKFSLRPDAATDEWMTYGLAYAGTSEYRTLVSLDFPYEEGTAFHDTHDDGMLPTNQYNWRIKATNESLAINGYSGYFRGSPDNQANFIRYVIGMSTNPVRDFVVDFFASLGHTKDAWAWIQGLVIGFGVVHNTFQLVLALNVSLVTRLYSKTGDRLMLQDVYSSIRQVVKARAALVLITLALNGLWSLEEWMITMAMTRYKLLPMFSLVDGVRSDFLALFLTWTDILATSMRVPFPPIIPTLVYVVCYKYSEDVVATLISPTMEAAVKDAMNEMYIRNLVRYSTTGMNLWTRYRLTNDSPSWLFATQFLWFFAPCAGMVLLVAVWKCVAIIAERVTVVDERSPDSVPADKMHMHPAVPLRFLDHFLPDCGGVHGLVSVRPTPFRFDKDAFEVNQSHLWRTGWVLLNMQFLVCTDDVPNIFLNVMANATLVKVYGCAVFLDTASRKLILAPKLVPLFTGDLTIWNLLRLRLETVWVKKVHVGEKQTTIRRMPGKKKKSTKVSPGVGGPNLEDVRTATIGE
ncbi:hypothetical protein H310_11025 [Aphanomyces invadans]|uniref:Transmembrane protein n=1 Tax=Aphanomyces invadans TaxID=157072 RepID=A0A024TN47_9STRA|nr:hypothetical protein H310_11025 [Aphanomyces invadans]ETV95590.1 hypothetical protein H310_11025 [Aphanomyces invadans]|eukprot:XP_008875783.1 hypothetical protein H310_11025 [Aphanomyces invadans]